jgi:hypothetical protein
MTATGKWVMELGREEKAEEEEAQELALLLAISLPFSASERENEGRKRNENEQQNGAVVALGASIAAALNRRWRQIGLGEEDGKEGKGMSGAALAQRLMR